jgi:hypothetical protein
MTILYDRINAILGRDCPALGGVSAEGISVIGELEERLEAAHELFGDIADATDLDSETNNLACKGMDLTDSVADYPPKGSL